MRIVDIGEIWRRKFNGELVKITEIETDISRKTFIHYKFSENGNNYRQYINHFCENFSKAEVTNMRVGEYVECANVSYHTIGAKIKIRSLRSDSYIEFEDDSVQYKSDYKPCLPPVEKVYSEEDIEKEFGFSHTESNIKINKGIKDVVFQDSFENNIKLDVYENSISINTDEIYYEDISKWIESLAEIKKEWDEKNA